MASVVEEILIDKTASEVWEAVRHRLVWTARGGPTTHYNASMQVIGGRAFEAADICDRSEGSDGACRRAARPLLGKCRFVSWRSLRM